jgi:hypothetical protein
MAVPPTANFGLEAVAADSLLFAFEAKETSATL